MKKNSLAIVLLTGLLFPVISFAQEAQKILPETSLVLPAASNVNVRWVFPPLPSATAAGIISPYKDINFSVDETGQPWIGDHDYRVMNLFSRFHVALSSSYREMVHLDNGALFFTSGDDFGFMLPGAKLVTNSKGLPVIPFQAVSSLPLPGSHMYK